MTCILGKVLGNPNLSDDKFLNIIKMENKWFVLAIGIVIAILINRWLLRRKSAGVNVEKKPDPVAEFIVKLNDQYGIKLELVGGDTGDRLLVSLCQQSLEKWSEWIVEESNTVPFQMRTYELKDSAKQDINPDWRKANVILMFRYQTSGTSVKDELTMGIGRFGTFETRCLYLYDPNLKDLKSAEQITANHPSAVPSPPLVTESNVKADDTSSAVEPVPAAKKPSLRERRKKNRHRR